MIKKPSRIARWTASLSSSCCSLPVQSNLNRCALRRLTLRNKRHQGARRRNGSLAVYHITWAYAHRGDARVHGIRLRNRYGCSQALHLISEFAVAVRCSAHGQVTKAGPVNIYHNHHGVERCSQGANDPSRNAAYMAYFPRHSTRRGFARASQTSAARCDANKTVDSRVHKNSFSSCHGRTTSMAMLAYPHPKSSCRKSTNLIDTAKAPRLARCLRRTRYNKRIGPYGK